MDESIPDDVFQTNFLDEECNGIGGTDENITKVISVENHTDANEEASHDFSNEDELENVNFCDRNEISVDNRTVVDDPSLTEEAYPDLVCYNVDHDRESKKDDLECDESHPPADLDIYNTNAEISDIIISTSGENEDELSEDVYLNSQDVESCNNNENTSESEPSSQAQTENISDPNETCTKDFDPSATIVDEIVQTSFETVEPGEKISPEDKSDELTSLQAENNSVVENDSEKQKSDSKSHDENEIESSDCQSDVEKTSIYLSFSDESDKEPSKKKVLPNTRGKTSKLISPNKIKRSPSSWSPRIKNVTSCSQASGNSSSALSSNIFVKEEILIDETDSVYNSYHLRRKTPITKPEVNNSNLIIDKNVKLLDIRVNLTKVDCSEYMSNKNRHVSFDLPKESNSKLRNKSLRNKQRNKIQADVEDNVVVKLPKCKLLLHRYMNDTEKSNVKSSSLQSAIKKRSADVKSQSRRSRRLLGKTPVFNDVRSLISRRKIFNASKSQRNIASKKPARRINIANKRTNSCGKAASAKKVANVVDHQHYTLDRLNTTVATKYSNRRRRNRSDSDNKDHQPTAYKMSSKMESARVNNTVSMDKYKHSLTVWYECLCCDQKYHKLDHIKEHVRGHFPDCLTS